MQARTRSAPSRPPLPPSERALHEAALAYLSRRSTSAARMKQVLERKVALWVRRAEKAAETPAAIATGTADATAAAGRVLERLRESGYLDDEKFAKHRAERLARAGKSRRAIEMDLAKNGVARELARSAMGQEAMGSELAAAVALVKRKRMGAYTRESGPIDVAERRRWLGALARAGYSFSTADRALRIDRDAAEELLRELF